MSGHWTFRNSVSISSSFRPSHRLSNGVPALATNLKPLTWFFQSSTHLCNVTKLLSLTSVTSWKLTKVGMQSFLTNANAVSMLHRNKWRSRSQLSIFRPKLMIPWFLAQLVRTAQYIVTRSSVLRSLKTIQFQFTSSHWLRLPETTSQKNTSKSPQSSLRLTSKWWSKLLLKNLTIKLYLHES